MRKVFLTLLILIFLVGCTRTQVAQEGRVSETYVEGYHIFVAEYDSWVTRVRLEGIPIISGVTYFVEEGEYTLTYEYRPAFSFGMELSYDRNDKGSDNTSMRDYTEGRIEERLLIEGETRIQLEGKNIEIDIRGEVGS